MSEYKYYIQQNYLDNKTKIINNYLKKNKKKYLLFLEYFDTILITNCIYNNNYLLYLKYRYPKSIEIYIGFIKLENNKFKININKKNLDYNISIYNFIYKIFKDIEILN